MFGLGDSTHPTVYEHILELAKAAQRAQFSDLADASGLCGKHREWFLENAQLAANPQQAVERELRPSVETSTPVTEQQARDEPAGAEDVVPTRRVTKAMTSMQTYALFAVAHLARASPRPITTRRVYDILVKVGHAPKAAPSHVPTATLALLDGLARRGYVEVDRVAGASVTVAMTTHGAAALAKYPEVAEDFDSKVGA